MIHKVWSEREEIESKNSLSHKIRDLLRQAAVHRQSVPGNVNRADEYLAKLDQALHQLCLGAGNLPTTAQGKRTAADGKMRQESKRRLGATEQGRAGRQRAQRMQSDRNTSLLAKLFKHSHTLELQLPLSLKLTLGQRQGRAFGLLGLGGF